MVPDETTDADARPADLTNLELAAWRGMLRVTHRVRQQLGDDLTRRHGLSMADYDVLVTLAAQPGHSRRMAALADEVLQPRSSLTRIVAGLERRGLVHRSSTPDDARGTLATLTPSGRRAFRRAHRTHIAGVRQRFLSGLSSSQLEQLAAAWATIDASVVEA